MTRKSHHSPKLHAAGDGRAFDRGDHRLVQFEPRRTERSAWNFAAIAARPGGRNIELAERMCGIKRADIFEVPAGAERAARAVEHRDRGIFVGVEFKKGRGQRIGARRVHGVAGFRPIVDHRPNRAVFLNFDCHSGFSSP